jgi:alkylation response protein AidB-like acyl-CoA dehydrogenase
MDYRDSPEEGEFRLALRAWLEKNVPKGWQDIKDDEGRRQLRKSWHRTLFDAGYVGLGWKVEYGGQGLSPIYDAILNEEAARVDAPELPSMISYLGQAVAGYATEEQKRRFLPPMLNGDVQWCQGFSEPSAGSDLAALRTRAVLDGGSYVVNGQKVWTSLALYSDWCLLLVRTDPKAPKHKGITCLLTPLDAPGITVRPIRLHNGLNDSAEVFLDDVRIPVDNRLGQEGDGWKLAMTTVSYERGAADVGYLSTILRQLDLIETEARGRGSLDDIAVRRALTKVWLDAEALRCNAAYQLSLRVQGKPPGPEGSIGKLLWSRAAHSVAHATLDVRGASSLGNNDDEWFERYLYSRVVSVYGGSTQIQKNIIARLLDMPRGN